MGSETAAVTPDRPLTLHDEAMRREGFRHLAGVDEVGAGCLAGPVLAAAVILPAGWSHPEIDDSKALTPRARERLAAIVLEAAVSVSVARIEAEEIDRLNILRARLRAMLLAVGALAPAPDLVLVDGHLPLPGLPLPQRALVKGDATSLAIAAASIVAKVARDRWMTEQAEVHPGYGFEKHKGYPSPEHKKALLRLGPCPLHRRSFAPVAELCATARPA